MRALLQERTIVLIVGKNFCGSLDALERVRSNTRFRLCTHLASDFVNNVPIHRHGRCFVHTADLGDNSSEGHGWHLEWTWKSSGLAPFNVQARDKLSSFETQSSTHVASVFISVRVSPAINVRSISSSLIMATVCNIRGVVCVRNGRPFNCSPR